MVRWLRWHCPPDTGFEIRALAVWGRARYLSVTEAPHNTDFHTWMGKKHFCFFQTAKTGNRTPDSGVKGSGANHYPRAPAPKRWRVTLRMLADKENAPPQSLQSRCMCSPPPPSSPPVTMTSRVNYFTPSPLPCCCIISPIVLSFAARQQSRCEAKCTYISKRCFIYFASKIKQHSVE